MAVSTIRSLANCSRTKREAAAGGGGVDIHVWYQPCYRGVNRLISCTWASFTVWEEGVEIAKRRQIQC